MKIIILNNDFRVYWKARLVYMRQFLAANDIELYAVELFGKGSPYSFDSYDNEEKWWTCLFPQQGADDLTAKEIGDAIFTRLDEIKPDVVIASSIVFYAGALSMRWAKKNKKKFIMFDDAKPWQVKRNFLIQYIKDLITLQSDALWFPSKDYETAYDYFYKKGLHFFYGYDCINNDFFKLEQPKEFNHHVFICVARLVSIKNINNLLKAWQQIEQKQINSQLLIIGTGPELNNLQDLATTLSLNQVAFSGTIDNNLLPSYFFNADAFILPSLSETWGLVVNEAMAAGLPILLSNKINACSTLLIDDVNGFSFDPYNVSEIAGAILKFDYLPVASKRDMSAKSLQIIDSMSYEKMCLQLIEALKRICDKKFKAPGLLPATLIKFWPGRYNTSGWDKL